MSEIKPTPPEITAEDMELWRDRHNMNDRMAEWDAMEARMAPLNRGRILDLFTREEVRRLRGAADTAREMAEWYDSEADKMEEFLLPALLPPESE